MTARTHDAFAFASLLTVAALFPSGELTLYTAAASVVGNIVGGLIPDMDQASNRLWDLLPAGDSLAKIFRRIFLKHRTITHSLLGAFLLYKLLEFALPKLLNPLYVNSHIVFISVMIGYISHLIADSFTKEGLPLFFPLGITVGIPPLKFLRVSTGSWVEKYLVLPGVGVYIFWFIGRYQESLLTVIKSIK
jgi:inner membrane protein